MREAAPGTARGVSWARARLARVGQPRRSSIVGRVAQYGVLVGFVAMVLYFCISRPDTFATWSNVANILNSSIVYLIFGAVVTLVLVINEFDLAFPYIADATTIIVAVLVTTAGWASGVLLVLAILVGIATGLVGGTVSGAIISRGRIPSFVVTLAVGSIFGGIELALQSRLPAGVIQISPVSLPTTISSVFNGDLLGSGLSSGLLFAAGAIAATLFLLRVTVFGRQMHAVGGNAHASFLASVPIGRVRLVTFALAGILSAVAGIAALGYQGYFPSAAVPYLLQAYTAAFLGRAVWRDRGFTMTGTLVAIFFLQVLSNGLSLLNEPTWIVSVISGVVLLVAVGATLGKRQDAA